MNLATSLANIVSNADTFRDAAKTKNVKVLSSLLGPAMRGFVTQVARNSNQTSLPASGTVAFDWKYEQNQAEFQKLYAAAKSSQWDGATQLDWSIEFDPYHPERMLVPIEWFPIAELPDYQKLNEKQKRDQMRAYMAWVLSQFLHGEQGALFAATQVTQAVPWFDGKLYGATQVVDEARHVEVFHRYLTTKLEKLYNIDDNLYVIIDALMSDSRFDLKFLGMQIMIEGLALGAFGVYRAITREPLLKELLKYVITDEARHVHYGVIALREHNRTLSDRERREREDWAFEMSLLMRNRFLLHEFYEEYYAHTMTRKQWDAWVLQTPMMSYFRKTMFERIVPNLKRIGLISNRVRPYYEEIGLLGYEHGKAAPDLTAADLLRDEAPSRSATA
jgi:hypothetical protein